MFIVLAVFFIILFGAITYQTIYINTHLNELQSLQSTYENKGIDHQTVGQLLNETKDTLQTIRLGSLLTVIASIIFIIFMIVVLKRSILKPLFSIIHFGKQIENGDFTNTLPQKYLERKDEIGDLARTFDKISETTEGILKRMLHNSEDLIESSQTLLTNSEQTGEAAQQIAITITEVAEGVTNQSKFANDILVKMRDAVDEISVANTEANKTLNSAKDASSIAHEGDEAINEAIKHLDSVTKTVTYATDSIQNLGKRSEEIGGIITVITSISEQTNLLALNAAIEAARAGEHGKGFAVVADEVRKLAEQSNQSAAQITDMIKDIQAETSVTVRTMESNLKAVEDQVEIIRKGGEALNQIVKQTKTTETSAQLIKEKLGSLEEDTKVVFSSIEEISSIIEESAAASEEVAASTEEQSATVNSITDKTAELVTVADQTRNELGLYKIRLSTNEVIELAKTDHLLWKWRIENMFAGRGKRLDSQKVKDHTICRLGKWYFGKGKELFGDQSLFIELDSVHANFHKACMEAIELYYRGDKIGAEGKHREIELLSNQVVEILDKLKA